MKIDQKKRIDEAVLAFQMIHVDLLNDVLKRRDIPSRQRKNICAEYLHDFYMILDQFTFACEGRRLSAALLFSERPFDPEEGIGPIKVLYTGGPNPLLSYCEYAIGTVSHYFNRLKQKATVRAEPPEA